MSLSGTMWYQITASALHIKSLIHCYSHLKCHMPLFRSGWALNYGLREGVFLVIPIPRSELYRGTQEELWRLYVQLCAAPPYWQGGMAQRATPPYSSGRNDVTCYSSLLVREEWRNKLLLLTGQGGMAQLATPPYWSGRTDATCYSSLLVKG